LKYDPKMVHRMMSLQWDEPFMHLKSGILYKENNSADLKMLQTF